MAWEYSEKTKQLFMDAVHGKPGTHLGEIPNADGFGEHGSIACGDSLRFTFRVEKNGSDPTLDKIVEARYLTFGCTSAIAALRHLGSAGLHADRSAEDHESGHRGFPRRSSGSEDPLLRHGCGGAGSRGCRLGGETRGRSCRNGDPSPGTARRGRGRASGLQVLQHYGAVPSPKDQGTESADDGAGHCCTESGRCVPELPSCPRRDPGYFG